MLSESIFFLNGISLELYSLNLAGLSLKEQVHHPQQEVVEELQGPGQLQVLHDPDGADEGRVDGGDDVALRAPIAAVLWHKVVGLLLAKPVQI